MTTMVGAGAGSGSLSPPSQSDQAQLRGRTTSLKRSLSDVIRKGTPNSPSHFSPLSATSHKRGFSEDLLKVDERSSNSLSPSRPSTSPPASSTRSPGLRLDINSFNKIFKNPKSASSGGAGAGGGGGGGGGERGDGGDTNDYHQQPASASLVMPPSSSLPLLSHSKMSSLPRSGHSSDQQAFKTFSELTPDDVQNLQIAAMKRLNTLFKTYKQKPLDAVILKNIQHCAQGISTKRKWIFPLFRRDKQYSSSDNTTTTVLNTHLSKSIHYASMPYGVSTSPLSPRRIPILVYECVRFIKQRDGMNASGVFRVNGSEKRMKDLLNVFDTGPRYGLGFSFDGYSVFDVAAYLKKYLRSLPEPLLSSELYPFFLKTLEIPPGDDRIQALRLLLLLLPPPHLVLFECLLSLISSIVARANKNHMTARNMGIIFAPTILRPRMAISSSTLSTATSSGTSSGVSSKLTSPTNLVGSGLPTAASIAAAAAQPLDEYEKSAAVIEYLIDYAPEFKLTSDSIRLFEVLDMKRLHIDGEEVQNSRVSSFDMINVVASQKSVSPSAAVTSPTKIVSGDDVFSVKEILNSIAPPPLRPPISPTSPSQPQPPTLSPAAPVTTSSSFVSSDLESAQQSSAPDSSNLSKPNVKLPPITSLPAVPKFATFSFNMDNIIKKVDEKEEFSSLAGSRIEEEEENDNGHKLVKRGTRKSTTNTSDHYGQGGAQFPNSSL